MGCVPEAHNKLAKEVGDSAIRDVGQDTIEKKGPIERIEQRFTELIPFEVPVADPLLIVAHPFDGQEPIAVI